MHPGEDCSALESRLAVYDYFMQHKYTVVLDREGEWFVATCAEVPGANGQGKTREEALESLQQAIDLVLDFLRDRALACRAEGSELVDLPA